ncbi:unnamed protein product [Didymodactylos carnosus]|uniref:Uncharacterized protein n=1 Tax=Didymodactylos carnosus TaxID=1234261 RepID=A0A8S2JEP2_9BILA|nr:unnamed protein product [Didymodactylos carnosus]CAF3796130.1 unnamed protein product [Didymodactylos carnosus]
MKRSYGCDISKEDLIDECRLFYNNIIVEQNKITDFNDNYASNEAIKWYTQDSFLYHLLNKAFRTENVDMLYKLRLFITDIENQIEFLHSKLIIGLPLAIRVYRGQDLHINELQILSKSIGKHISFNSFLSPTLDREFAIVFADKGRTINEAVLFEIDRTAGKRTKSFALVENSEEKEI